jgi:hypothetical protein
LQEEEAVAPGSRTRAWKAWQNVQPGTGKPKLIVSGEVEVTNTNQNPRLSEHAHQDADSKTLLLDLTIESRGVGNTVIVWKEAHFEKVIAKDRYSDVDILLDGGLVGHADVETAK